MVLGLLSTRGKIIVKQVYLPGRAFKFGFVKNPKGGTWYTVGI